MRGSFLLTFGYLLLSQLVSSGNILYVDVGSPNPIPPYTHWASAAVTVQDAVDAARAGDQILVTNGVYVTGGRVIYGTVTNRVAVDRAVTVQSVNGPAVTIIEGFQIPYQPSGNTNAYLSARCAYLTNGAALNGFTLTNGGVILQATDARDKNAGGVWCESDAIVSNCVIRNSLSFGLGGGVYQGVCFNCTILSNSTAFFGGGACAATLNNCVLAGNQQVNSSYGGSGGAHSCLLTNCALSNNYSASAFADLGGGGAGSSTLDHCTISQNTSSYMGGGAFNSVLRGCTLSGNYSDRWGGGAYNSSLKDCTVVGNVGRSGGGGVRYGGVTNCSLLYNTSQSLGGGAKDATLVNCRIFGNGASGGGGVAYSTTINCTVVSNSSGAYSSALANSIVYFNGTSTSPNYDGGSSLSFCCAMPLATNGPGNIAGPPYFADATLADLHLQSNSACINAGANAYVSNPTDLDGLPRIVGGTVDMGAYENQSPALLGFYSWLQKYGLPTDAGANLTDSDGDGMNNWQEWIAGTDPTNGASNLKINSLSFSNANSAMITWQSVTNRFYFLQRSTDLATQPAFSTISSNIPGQSGTTTFVDINEAGSEAAFYRVGVQ